MMGEMWWKRMVNSVRFLDDAQDFIESGKSVILNFPDAIPWLDIMTEELGQRIRRTTDSKTFEIRDVSTPVIEDKKSRVLPPGEYLFRNFCKESDRNTYWPTTHKCYERFMSSCKTSPLNRRFLCAVGINSGSASAWVKSVTEYLETCEMEEHGIFILVTQGANVRSSEYMECLQFSDYITDYDCMMLCLTMISSLPCSRTQKLYLAEVASNISCNNIENAGLLVSAETELIKNPIKVVKEVFNDNNIKCTRIEEKVNSGVWEAQIRLVFPKLEDFRNKIIQKYESKIQKFLPITNSMNERIDKARDLEIGQLYTVCLNKNIVDHGELELLKKMRKARNDLAHRNPLSFSQIKDLGIF